MARPKARPAEKEPSAPKTRSLVSAALAKTTLPQAVRDEIEGIRADLDAEYRDHFIAMTAAIANQATAQARILRTLELLVEATAPHLRGHVPGLSIAPPGSTPDLAMISLPADPIGAGYSLTQQGIADALQCSSADISILLKHHPLKHKQDLAIVVRRGKTQETVNYHRRAVDELLSVIERPPPTAHRDMVKAIERIRRRRSSE